MFAGFQSFRRFVENCISIFTFQEGTMAQRASVPVNVKIPVTKTAIILNLLHCPSGACVLTASSGD